MKLPALLVLFLSSVVSSSAWAGTEGAQGRRAYNSPSTENVIDFQSDQNAGAYCGQLTQFVVPGDALEAAFPGSAGKASHDPASEPDYLYLVMPAASMDSSR
jgi:hypothetical protein